MEKINALIDKLQELKNSNAGLQIIAYHTQLLQSEVLRAQLAAPEAYAPTSGNIAVILPAARVAAAIAEPVATATTVVMPAAKTANVTTTAGITATSAAKTFTPAAHAEVAATSAAPVVPVNNDVAAATEIAPAANTDVTNIPEHGVSAPAANANVARTAEQVIDTPAANATEAKAPEPPATTPAANATEKVVTPAANTAPSIPSEHEKWAMPAPKPAEKPAIAATAPTENSTPENIPLANPGIPAPAAREAREAPAEKASERAFVTVTAADLNPPVEKAEKASPFFADSEANGPQNFLNGNRPKTIVGKAGAPGNTLFDTPTPTKETSGIRNELHELAGKNMASLNDRLRSSKTELGDKLGDTRVADLRQAIGINDKFQFIQELFRGDVDMYERSVRTINEFSSFQEADLWIQRELKIKLGWQDDHTPVQHFYGLLKKRFS